jgi:DNA-directed RNA polymerase specialized sigma24 family protein
MYGDRSKLSPWHFAARPPQEKKLNKVQAVNAVGKRYALERNPSDAGLLLGFFYNYIMKYAHLLISGNLPDGRLTSDTRKFLSLFMKPGDYSPSELYNQYRKVAERLPNAFMQSMVADDVYNELVLIFLKLASDFNPDIGGFTGYIYTHWKYRVKSRMFQVQKDAMNYLPLYDPDFNTWSEYPNEDKLRPEVIEDHDGILCIDTGRARIELAEDGLYEIVPIQFDLPKLNFAFINTPPAGFSQLWNKMERTIIVYRYFVDMSYSAISHKLRLGGAAKVRELHDAALQKYREWAENHDRNIDSNPGD